MEINIVYNVLHEPMTTIVGVAGSSTFGNALSLTFVNFVAEQFRQNVWLRLDVYYTLSVGPTTTEPHMIRIRE